MENLLKNGTEEFETKEEIMDLQDDVLEESEEVEVSEDIIDEELLETPEEIEKPPTTETLIGMVSEGNALYLRKQPMVESEVVTTMPEKTMVLIDQEESTDTFYKVCTEFGVEGFCMKQFVELTK